MAGGQNTPARLLAAVHDINEEQKKVLPFKLRGVLGNLRSKVIAVWGLAFKPNTDDVREAPSLTLIREAVEAGAHVRAYDPRAARTARDALGAHTDNVTLCDSADAACDGAHVLVVVTEWLEFRSPDFNALARKLRDRVLVDGRNLYDPHAVRDAGLRYVGIGRCA
jgi:UDPglucose 6-dehydrogenase